MVKARIAQLVEHNLAKVGVVGSNPISRSFFARMVELVDTQDLKSCGPYSPCGFKSHSGYSFLIYRVIRKLFYFFLFLVLNGCQTSYHKEEKNLIKDYVSTPETSYRYEIVDTVLGDGWKEYKVRMVSGSWLDKTNFDDSSNDWWHWVSIIVPDDLDNANSMMVIGSGSTQDFTWDNHGNKKTNSQYLKAALKTKSIISEINNVPFQPIDFSEDAKEGRYEDDLIAYSWIQFLEGGAKELEWLPRFPMTRAVVRAMDVVQEISEKINNPVDSFFVTGASKRGWVTWTTAIADDRVMGIAPVVIDLLNLYPSFQHHWKVYGEWSPAIDDYVKEDIMNWTESKEYEKLIEITDPYSYRSSLDMPKYIINASSDEFFVTDSWQFYWDDLFGEKHLQYIPNAGHGLYGTYVTDDLINFYNKKINKKEVPNYEWSVDQNIFNIIVDPSSDYRIKKWSINNSERDFRLYKVGESWKSNDIIKNKDGKYSITIDNPVSGYSAHFIEIIFGQELKESISFTTGTVVLPNKYPFPKFVIPNPKGKR